MSIYEKASLILNTYSAVCNTNRTSCTWSNIDLRMLLGDMYDKYDRFNLCLNIIAQSSTDVIFTDATDHQCLVRVSGLPWINNSYNITSTGNNNNNYTIIGTFLFMDNSNHTQHFNNSNISTFGKNQDMCNITIDYLKNFDLTIPDSTNPLPQMTFIFYIYGIDEFKTNSTDRRIKI